MSLAAFQRELSSLIASPDRCHAVLADPQSLNSPDLTPRERARLLSAVRQRGMATNCALYRANRLAPIHGVLRQTCLLLGAGLRAEVDLYWAQGLAPDLRFRTEAQRFAAFLRGRLESAALQNPYLEEIMTFELCLAELRAAPRGQQWSLPEQLKTQRASWQLHPLLRSVLFRHDPAHLLGILAQDAIPPPDLPCGQYGLLVDAREEAWELRVVHPEMVLLLQAVQQGYSPGEEEWQALRQAGWLVSGSPAVLTT